MDELTMMEELLAVKTEGELVAQVPSASAVSAMPEFEAAAALAEDAAADRAEAIRDQAAEREAARVERIETGSPVLDEALAHGVSSVLLPSERVAPEQEVSCKECRERQANALLSELALRHAAEERERAANDRSLEFLAARDAALAERDAVIVERDARIADEALRAQRVDVEALRAKVLAMKKNLAAVDARADERFAAQLRTRDAEVEARIAAVRAEVQPALDELAAVRFGEAIRAEAINAAMEAIWAFDRRDKGAPKKAEDLVRNLTQIMSMARRHPQ